MARGKPRQQAAVTNFWVLHPEKFGGEKTNYFDDFVIKESISSTSLNGSSQNFNIWRVSVGNRTLRRDFSSIGG